MLDDVNKELFKLLEGVFALGHVLASAINEPMFIAASNRCPQNGMTVSYGQWVGNTSVSKLSESRAPWIANWKLTTVMQQPAEEGIVLASPDKTWSASVPWQGALRLWHEFEDVGIACSKWDERFDHLLGSILLYNAMYAPLRFHHVGFRYPTEDSYSTANSRPGGIFKPTEDHLRMYFRYGMFPLGYIENQFFPGGPHDNARHWDLQAPNPNDFLRFVGKCVGVAPVFWEYGENDPIGMVKVTPSDDGEVLSVMSRARWTPIEDW